MKFSLTADGWKDYGYLAAVDPQYARAMSCAKCKTRWTGCWDAFECPECGEGELPVSAAANQDLPSDTDVEGLLDDSEPTFSAARDNRESERGTA